MPGIATRKLVPGKIYPFKHAAWFQNELRQYDIHCFGRYATWDSNELVHHTVRQLRTRPWVR